jgi:RNA polymerase sigma-70 factor (ECF subfamily)
VTSQVDARWLEQLFVDHHAWILGWLTTKTRNPALAEDLTAATFERALRYAGRFDGRNPGGWLRVIARNLLLDHHKAAATQRETAVAEFADTASEPGPDNTIIDREQTHLASLAASELAQRITNLPGRRQAEVLHMRLVQGRSIPQTARILGISEGSVKTAQHHGTTRLLESIAARPILIHRTKPHRTRPGRCQWRAGCPMAATARNHCARHYAKLHRTGRLPASAFTDPKPARDHIRQYLANDGAIRELARAAGLPHATIRRIATGEATRIRHDISHRIRATPMRPSHDDCARYVHELRAAGMTGDAIARAAGLDSGAARPGGVLYAALAGGRFTTPVALGLRREFEAFVIGKRAA